MESNNMLKYLDLKPGSEVFVYIHSSKRIKEATVIGIEGEYHKFPNNGFDGLRVHFTFSTLSVSSYKKETFYIDLNDHKNRRGGTYTGFLTHEDAVEFHNYLVEIEIKQTVDRVESLKKSLIK